MRSLHSMAIAALLVATPAISAFAQTGDQSTLPKQETGPAVQQGDRAPAPAGPGSSSLSEPLSRSNGVITPPRTGDPSVIMPPPAGKTPIIPPPGTPGGNPEVQPK
jgi:hypothetical protein